MFKKALLILVGLVIVCTLLALWLGGWSLPGLPLPSPEIDTTSVLPTLSPLELIAQMDAWVETGQGNVAGTDIHLLYDFDNNKVWELERIDRDNDGFFEEALYDLNQDGEKDYLRIDANRDQQFNPGELYQQAGGLWVLDTVPLEIIDALDEAVAMKAGHVEQKGAQIRYDINENGRAEVIEYDNNGDGQIDIREYDLDEDGAPEYRRLAPNRKDILSQPELYRWGDGKWEIVYSAEGIDQPSSAGDPRTLLRQIENRALILESLPREQAKEKTMRLSDGSQTIMLLYDPNRDGRFDIATLDLDGDEYFETVMFDFSGDGRADYLWRDLNDNGSVEETEVSQYTSTKGWVPLFPEVLPFPMPFPALYLP